MNKLIGIVGQRSDNKNTFAQEAYLTYLSMFGNVVIIDPLEETVISQLDLLVLPGGLDVDPARYGEVRHPLKCSHYNPWFEYFDKLVLPKYIDNQTPILGICRGMQSLNVHFGGTLYQHIDHPHSGEDRTKRCHKVRDISSNRVFEVNSLHHQAVKELGKELVVTLYGAEKKEVNNVVEAFKHKTLPIYGVQCHPEELYDDYFNKEIEKLLNVKQSNN